MQKFLNIAEQYVQWIALGIGALFLVFMGWSYVYKSDINVALGPKQAVEPGEIDKTIADGPVNQLVDAMNPTTDLKIDVPNVVEKWSVNVAETVVDVRPLPGVSVPNSLMIGGPDNQGALVKGGNPGQKLIDKLPQLPPAVPVAVATYRTVVETPDPAFVAPTDNPNAPAPLIEKDIDAASVQFKIDHQALAKAFVDAFGANAPPKVFATMYLQTTLYREEALDATGTKWSTATVVPPLAINVPPVFPSDSPAQPDGFTYELWAGAHQEQIIHPPFYQTAPGAPPWTVPQPPGAADAGGAPGAAAGVGAGAVAPGAVGGIAPAGVPGGFGNRNFPQPGYPQPYRGGTDQAPPPIPGMDQAGAINGGWQGTVFNPLAKSTDDIILAHDDTIVPEKTYRYFVQYRLLSPLFASSNLAQNVELTKRFALVSPGPLDIAKAGAPVVALATPTEKLAIPSRTALFVKQVHGSPSSGNLDVHFAVFVFAPGPKETEVVAGPGDSIAPTHWTLVDVRKNPLVNTDWKLLLVDDDGNMQQRDLLTDQSDQTQKDLHDRANQATTPPGSTPGAPPGPGPGQPAAAAN